MKYVFCVITKLYNSQIFHVKIYTGTQLPFLGAFDHLQSVSLSRCIQKHKYHYRNHPAISCWGIL